MRIAVTVMPAKTWPPPGFPLIQGDHALTELWSIHLPEQFARRIEDGDLVFWRPGLTIWLAVWGNNEVQAARLAKIKDGASPARFDARESVGGGVTRFSYRLREANVESLNAYVIGDDEHLQISAYFDGVADATRAQRIVDSVVPRRQAE